MRALVVSAPNEFAVQDVERPTPGPNEVLCKVRAIAICGTDPHIIQGHYPGFWPQDWPLIPGHEWCGEVVETGSAVRGLQSGDAVVGECVVGPAGRDHFGFSIDGADAEYFKARGEWLHKLPEGISFTEGAMIEPLSVAYNATVLAGGIDPADVVAVLGGGPIGLLCVMAAAANNASSCDVEKAL